MRAAFARSAGAWLAACRVMSLRDGRHDLGEARVGRVRQGAPGNKREHQTGDVPRGTLAVFSPRGSTVRGDDGEVWVRSRLEVGREMVDKSRVSAPGEAGGRIPAAFDSKPAARLY